MPTPAEESISVVGIGFLVGYFIMYSIRSGTKTQEVFKSFFGLVGVGGVGAAVVASGDVGAGLSDAVGYGIIAYFGLTLLLTSVYTVAISQSRTNAALWARILGRTLLGEVDRKGLLSGSPE